MASYERHNGSWSVRYRDHDGRNRRKAGFPQKRDAQLWEAQRNLDYSDGIVRDRDFTFRMLADKYLATHDASEARLDRIRKSLASPIAAFGDSPVCSLSVTQIATWRRTVESDHARHMDTRSVKQVLNAAVEWGLIRKSPASGIKNPAPLATEQMPFKDWAEVEELDSHMPIYQRGMLIVVVGTGMRPQEFVKLEVGHVDLSNRVITLPASVSKTKRPRSIPLRQRAVDELARVIGERESGMVFTDYLGKPLDARDWRKQSWLKAIARANEARTGAAMPPMPHRRPYDMRHTYATWALRAGVNTFAVARRMGTSIRMIDLTYGHHAVDSDDHERALLDAFDGARMGEFA